MIKGPKDSGTVKLMIHASALLYARWSEEVEATKNEDSGENCAVCRGEWHESRMELNAMTIDVENIDINVDLYCTVFISGLRLSFYKIMWRMGWVFGGVKSKYMYVQAILYL